MGEQFFRKLWNYQRSESALAWPCGLPGSEVVHDHAWERYRRFLTAFRRRTEYSPPAVMPTTAGFGRDTILAGGERAALALLVPHQDLVVVQEFCVRVFVGVSGVEFQNYIFNRSYMEAQSSLYLVPCDLSWCVAQSHDQEWHRVIRDER